MDLVGAIRLRDGNIHELLQIFRGAHQQAGLQRNVRESLVRAPGRPKSLELVKLVIFGSRVFGGRLLLQGGSNEDYCSLFAG